MGVRSGQEIGYQRETHSFTATGSSDTFYPRTDARGPDSGCFNYSLSGTFVGTVVVEKTFDGGTTWLSAFDKFGASLSKTAPAAHILEEHEKGVGYRARVSAYTSGTINIRFSQ